MKTAHTLLLFFAVLLIVPDRNPDLSNQNSTQIMLSESTAKHYIFVPGSFHGAWCWYKMQPLLSQNGNTCEAIDLPGHGLDDTPLNQITLESYVDAVCKIISTYNEPVILIGHSRAGIVISEVAERMPDKIEKLVYLCAFLIPDGEPMVATALADTGSVLVSNLIFNEAEGWHFPNPDAIQKAFYNDCSEEDVALCKALLTKEPLAPLATPLHLTPEKYGSVKKVYIHTSIDNTLTYGMQKKMVERVPVDQTFELKSGHSPFLSQPKELSKILLQL